MWWEDVPELCLSSPGVHVHVLDIHGINSYIYAQFNELQSPPGISAFKLYYGQGMGLDRDLIQT